MSINRFVVELNAALFGKDSLSYRALEQAKALGGDCTFILEDRKYIIVPKAA